MDFAREADVPPELIEQIKKMFPGYKIEFAGTLSDEGKLPKNIDDDFDSYKIEHQIALAAGLCGDCGKKMPTPPEGKKYAKGWGYFRDIMDGSIISLQCPECHSS